MGCAEAPVGHGRGRSGSGRVRADGWAARLPELSGGPRAVGLGATARCARGRLAPAAASPVRLRTVIPPRSTGFERVDD